MQFLLRGRELALMMCGAAADPVGVSDCGFFLFVVDPGLLTGADDYRQRVGAYADSLRTTRPLDPAKPVRAPFERSAAERERRRTTDVVDVPDETYEAPVKLTQPPAPRPAPAPQTEGSTMSIDGAWTLVIKSPMGDQTSTLTAAAQGSDLTGSMSGAAGRSTIENGKVEGDQVSWSAKITSPMPLTLEFSGTVSGDSLTGNVKLGAFGSASFTGERA